MRLNVSDIELIDRKIEQALDRDSRDRKRQGRVGEVADLMARRVELTEPPAFSRIEKLLGRRLVA